MIPIPGISRIEIIRNSVDAMKCELPTNDTAQTDKTNKKMKPQAMRNSLRLHLIQYYRQKAFLKQVLTRLHQSWALV